VTPEIEGAALLWKRVGIGMSGSYLASNGELALMDSERVYVADGFGGSGDRYHVTALSIESGETVWRRSDLTAPNVVDDVFLQALSADLLIVNGQYGNVSAVDAATGTTMWSFPLPDRYGAVRSTITGDDLIVITSAPMEGDLRPPIVYSLDLYTGDQQWSTELTESTQAQWHSPPVSDGLVFVTSTQSYLDDGPANVVHALDIDSGEIIWSVDLGGTQGFHFSPAVIAGDLLVVRSQGDPIEMPTDISALHVTDGFQEWTYPGANLLAMTPDGDLVAHDGGIILIDPTSGEMLERLLPATELEDFQIDTATLSEGVLILSGWQGVRGYDLQTGERVFRWEIEGAVSAGPTSGGLLLIPGERSVSLIRLSKS
jgi:outer membrane protein assembly factor BamB